jgi:long-chain acyl-CoA synthetase
MAAGLVELADADPHRFALGDPERRYTRAELNDRVNRFIHVLHRRGVRSGDVVAIYAGNSADMVIALLASSLAGVSHVAINWHLVATEVEYILASSGTNLVITDRTHEAVARDAARQVGIADVLVLGPDADAELASAPNAEPAPCPVASAIYYTSGTTGRPKATRMAEMREGITAQAQAEQVRASGMEESDVQLVVGPLYHGGPLMQAVRTAVTGGHLHVMARFDAEELLRLVDRYRVNRLTMTPTHFVRLLRLPAEVRARYDVSSLTDVLHIGAMMPPEIKAEMIAWWGPVLVDAYGCSELGTITRITSQEWLTRPGSVGRPMPWFTIQIVDEETDLELPARSIGTIFLTALNDADIVYLGDPERTAEAHRSPRQFTLRDLGWLDDDGYLYLADRRVDLIVSGGVNIYPAEVEAALLGHPAVEDVGVFAVPDPEWGHAVRAAVQLSPGWAPDPSTTESILGVARTRLAGFKVPRAIEYHERLPRSAAGKLLRRELRAVHWKETV